jgi:osmoprotectant transport system permease protein
MNRTMTMGEYWARYSDRLISALIDHLEIVGWTLLFSIVLASVITVIIMPHDKVSRLSINMLGAVYSIPSLALFAVLIPVFGIGKGTAIIVLTAYNQFLLVRNFLAGFDHVDGVLKEAAQGMGMTAWQSLLRVKLPLAFPAILAGIRMAVISTINIATIAATINAGGLGMILFDGLRTRNTTKLLWGVLLSAGLAVIVNIALSIVQKLVERRFQPKR